MPAGPHRGSTHRAPRRSSQSFQPPRLGGDPGSGGAGGGGGRTRAGLPLPEPRDTPNVTDQPRAPPGKAAATKQKEKDNNGLARS